MDTIRAYGWMKRRVTAWLAALVCTLMVTTAVVGAAGPQAATTGTEKWLHVSVNSNSPDGERVRVNVPLSLAEKVLGAINKDKLQAGKIRIHQAEMNGIDLKAILEAVKTSRDGEFVTVEGKRQNVRVAKEGGHLLVKAEETKTRQDKDGNSTQRKEKVDVRLPMSVVDALLSGGTNELDLLAAVRALAAYGEGVLVTAEDGKDTVRIWVDSKNTSTGS